MKKTAGTHNKHWEEIQKKFQMFQTIYKKTEEQKGWFGVSLLFFVITMSLFLLGVVGLFLTQGYFLIISQERLSIGRYIAIGVGILIYSPFWYYLSFNNYLQILVIGSKERMGTLESYESIKVIKKYDLSKMGFGKIKFTIGLMNFCIRYMQITTGIFILGLLGLIILNWGNIVNFFSLKLIGVIIIILLIVMIIILKKKNKEK